MRRNPTPQVNAGRVDLSVEVIELLSRQESKYTEEQIRAFEVRSSRSKPTAQYFKRV